MAKETIKVKVALIGPCESGKTLLANFLADATENTIEEYLPTKVARALEFETVSLPMFFSFSYNYFQLKSGKSIAISTGSMNVFMAYQILFLH